MLKRFAGLVVSTLVLVGVSVPARAQDGSVSLPTSWFDTTYPTQSGVTRTVCSSGCTHTSLQSAIDAAVPGDTISLTPGSVHDFITLRGDKPDNGKWIVIRSSSPAFDPGGMLQPGVRVDGDNWQHTAQMAQIRSTSGASAIDTEFGAHHYRIVGLDITSANSSAGLQTFVELGDATSSTPGARDIVIDRVFIHGRPSGSFRRGVSMNGARLALIDSQVMEIHDDGGNENAAGAWNGPGPIKIVNNRLESAGVIVMFGGSDPGSAAMNPADLELRGNLLSRPLAWRGVYWIKNLLELKNLNRALVEGNIFENNWVSGQKGHALLFTVRNQDGNCPTCTVQDITLRNNILRNSPTAVSILGTDDLNTSGYTGDLLFTNNIFDNIDYPTFAEYGTSHTILITEGPRYVTFERNTFINQANFGAMIAFGGNGTTTGFVFRKNLMRKQEYGVIGDSASPGSGALDTFAPGWVFELNGIAGSSATHPANNQYISTTSWESQFVRYNGGQNGDYRLKSPNAYSSAGITDAGADIAAVLAATACTISGNCAGASVPPPPDPVLPAGGDGDLSAAGPWTDQGIGGQSGSSGYASGVFTVSGAGADIWGSSDDFRYVSETLSGDGQIVARVTSLQNTHPYAKAGIMIRGSLNANAAHAMLDVGPGGGVEWMTRAVTGGDTTFLAGTNRPAPVWLRLTRAGATMTGEVSSNGTTWTLLGRTTLVLGQQVYVGLFVCSHDSGTLNTATFDNVSVTAASGTGPSDIVVRAVDLPASARHGIWSTASDTTAAGGTKLTTSDTGWSSLDTPLASPANYVDVPFNADAGTPYRVWLRLKARGNSKWNDAVWVQFSDARVNGSPAYPLNSTSGLLVNLATDSGASSLVGWGWQNSAYWLSQATTVTFANSGAHTLRIQVREDGVEVDQVVLSPATYLNAPPGSVTNDSTVLAVP